MATGPDLPFGKWMRVDLARSSRKSNNNNNNHYRVSNPAQRETNPNQSVIYIIFSTLLVFLKIVVVVRAHTYIHTKTSIHIQHRVWFWFLCSQEKRNLAKEKSLSSSSEMLNDAIVLFLLVEIFSFFFVVIALIENI